MSSADLARYFLAKEPGEPPELQRAAVYRRLVRANLRSGAAYAFPATRSLLGEDGFTALIADFLEAGGPRTSFYHDIPLDLVGWAEAAEHPLADLLQWEWLRIVAGRHPADLDALAAEPGTGGEIRPNPTMQIGVYSRPVEKISPETPEPEPYASVMAYLVWRRPETDRIETHKVGLLLARALALAAEAPATADVLADRLAAEIAGIDRSAILESLAALERELRERDGVLP
jgi:hypothetical protein